MGDGARRPEGAAEMVESCSVGEKKVIRVGHSPDPDDAFMFYALAKDKIDTGNYRFVHELVDIETLNRRALEGDLDLTALSVHAYAYLSDRYVLCTCGASMGDQYGPMVVTRREMTMDELASATIAIPGTRTTAYLALRLCLNSNFQYVVVPFDKILDAVASGSYEGRYIDAGLVIHEGQLTYGSQQLKLAVDLGQWWFEQKGFPLPLGVNGLRKDLGPETIANVHRLLRQSIDYGLEHRGEALDYAMGFGRGLDRQTADQFIEMYVNRWTVDLGVPGRKAVAYLLAEGYNAGVVPNLVVPEFVG